MRGEWLCARCGLRRTTSGDGPPNVGRSRRRTWSRALKAAIGSGLVAKVLIGAVAVAAVGGAIVTENPPVTVPASTPPASTLAGPTPAAPGPADTPVPSLPDPAADRAGESVPSDHVPAEQAHRPFNVPGNGMPPPVAAYVGEVHRWSECVGESLREFEAGRPGANGDPGLERGPRPEPNFVGGASSKGSANSGSKPPPPKPDPPNKGNHAQPENNGPKSGSKS